MPGGGWLLSYHQDDNADPDAPDTTEALRRCIDDRVPVGVLRERAPARHDAQYDVLGLALPVWWSDRYFFFESLDPPAQPVTDPVSVLEAAARPELEQETSPGGEGLSNDYDARLRVYRQIVARSGQPGFRVALLEVYQGRCAITGCDAPAALEAAHLRPYRGPDSNTVTNGLLLRADIHTLLDLRLLAPDPVTRTITVSKLLAGTQYEALTTCQLADPAAAWQRPDQDALEITWQDFRPLKMTGSSDDLSGFCPHSARGWPASGPGRLPPDPGFWPSGRRGSRVKHDFACTFTWHYLPVLVALRVQSCLRLEGRARTLSRPSPDLSPVKAIAPFPRTSSRTRWSHVY